MNGPHRRCQAGFTFAELAFGLLVFVIAAAVLVNHLTVNYQTTMSEKDRVFAYSKAQAILSEIQSYVDHGQVDAAVDLDVLDDGAVNNPLLTIQQHANGTPYDPDAELSGNHRAESSSGTAWTWSRRITVLPFAGLDNRNVRYVTVRIFKRDLNGTDRPVADLSAVINSAGDGFPTTQVFDVYLLAIENIPGWWVYMDSIRPFVESAITDLETRNPGLEVRTHWITKSSFGRNQVYRPYFNEARDSWQTIPKTYFYPAKMPAGMSSAYYYVPENVRGHINLDGTDAHGYDPDLNPHPYALADFFNHAMRYPQEKALWEARVRAIEDREQRIAEAKLAGSLPPDELDDMSKEPTLRLFLEDLNTSPLKYKNALIVNLHGELLPMPPLRNFADPARSPEMFPEVRVVTHAEELRTQHSATGSTDAARFRVYAFNSNTQTYTGAATLPVPIAVEVVGVKLTETTLPTRLLPGVALQCLRGGVLVGGVRDYSPFANAKHELEPRLAGEMYYSASWVPPSGGSEGFTRILLYNTPVVAPPVADATAPANVRGLNNDERSQLYWMAYVPSSCDTAATQAFARDLSAVGAGPKNTARWRFCVPASCITDGSFRDTADQGYVPQGDIVLSVRTRIWTGAGAADSGTMWPTPNDPDNLSTTYTWWADSATDVPMTERAQFLGDPRHCPYRDVLNVAGADFPNTYNWDHDTLNNAAENSVADYRGLTAANLRNGWRGVLTFDVGRTMEVWRKGLVGSGCVYTTLTGFSYYYVGLGNDIGYDSANGYANSIPVEYSPLGTPGTAGYLDTITGSRRLVRDRRSPYWFGMPWLGELYPDWAYGSQWMGASGGVPDGNLTAGSSGSNFYQVAMNSAYSASNRTAYGTSLVNSQQRTSQEGCTSLFNIGTTTSTFHHQSVVGTGSLTATGSEIATNYNFTMPTTATISRPFSVATNTAGTVGDEFSLSPFNNERFAARLLRTYYTHPSGTTGSGLVQLSNTANSASAFIVVNGIDNTTSTGTTFIGKWAVLSLVHSYFEAGNPAVVNRIKMPPRVDIVTPNNITELDNPAQVAIQVSTQWERWDGQNYTASNLATEPESELEYAVYFSNDNGSHWYHIADNTPGTPGERPDSAYLLADAGTGNEIWAWDVPASSFPEGSYLLRVDCFRIGANVHFSYHKTKFFIRR